MPASRVKILPLLNPKILNAFLEEYLKEKQPSWQSIPGWIINFFTDLTISRKSICEDLKIQFDRARQLQDNIKTEEDLSKTIDTWINICNLLAEKAIEAENNRTLSFAFRFMPEKMRDLFHYQTNFSKILHLLRSLIIRHINEKKDFSKSDEKDQANDIYYQKFKNTNICFDLFSKKLTVLIKEKSNLLISIRKEELQGHDATHLKNEYKKHLLKLSALNDPDSILDAKEKGLLDQFKLPMEQDKTEYRHFFINPNLPLCYQQNFFYICYDQVFFPTTKIAFHQFIKSAEQFIPTQGETKDELKLSDLVELDESEANNIEEAPEISQLEISDPAICEKRQEIDGNNIDPQVKEEEKTSDGTSSKNEPTKQSTKPTGISSLFKSKPAPKPKNDSDPQNISRIPRPGKTVSDET